MTTPLPILAPKKDYTIIAPERKRSAVPLTQTITYNLKADSYQLTAGGYNLVVPGLSHFGNAYEIAAPQKNYTIIAPERNNG